MKTAAHFDDVIGTSHGVDTRALLRDHTSADVAELPIEAGTITGDATRSIDRWAAPSPCRT